MHVLSDYLGLNTSSNTYFELFNSQQGVPSWMKRHEQAKFFYAKFSTQTFTVTIDLAHGDFATTA
ncbi:uncharacterized protein LOC143144233 [Ptiloglossa arizonensis]|uniref:uncharacterized protein LOC143144233 n=1 Tax=Ptiloglossa arizonensis TaxID=3350558 RepID=UPI003F9FA785